MAYEPPQAQSPAKNLPRSLHFPPSKHNPGFPSSHRRYNSEPSIVNNAGTRRMSTFVLIGGPPPNGRRCDITFSPTPDPAPVTLKPQYSIRRPRPNTEFFGPEIVLGEPREHVGHPKTRIGQSALKLAAIKERMDLLEAANDLLKQRIESHRTDAEMLSSSVTYFSSEYYAGLLTIRDLRSRSRQDAEIMSNQEQQLCQLKKFVGLMVEAGLHEPVLERAHKSVVAGKNFEPVLVEAIRSAASRRGSAWFGILSAAAAQTVAPTVGPPDVFEERQSTVDDLLKNLKNGDIPSGRHRLSVSQRFSPQLKKSPSRNRLASSTEALRVKSPKVSGQLLSPRSPGRSPLKKVDTNRSPQNRKNGRSNKPATRKTAPLGEQPTTPESESTQRALASLQRILDNFSSDSIGSLGTTTEGSHSTDCDGSQTVAVPPVADATPSTSTRSPPPLCVRPPTVCFAIKRSAVPAPSPTRRTRNGTAVPSPTKIPAACPTVSPRRVSELGTAGTRSRKGGWR